MKKNKIFILILGISILLRLIPPFFIDSHKFIFSDSYDYHKIAINFLNNKGLILSETQKAVRAPLYPLFLSIFYFFNIKNLLYIRLIQGLLNGLFVIFIYKLCLLIFEDKFIGLISCFLYACDIFNILFSSLILTESLFTGILLIIVILSYRIYKEYYYNKDVEIKEAIFLGVICGIGSLFRESFVGFAFFVCIIFFFLFKEKKIWLKCSLIIIISFILSISPWTIRNYIIFKHFIPITTRGGIALYEALGPNATGGPRMNKIKLPKSVENLSEIEKDIYLRKLTLKYAIFHLKRTLYLAIVKQIRLWNIFLNGSKYKDTIIDWILGFFNIFIYFFSLLGIIKFIKNKKIILILSPILYFSLLHSIFLGSVRYRVPFMALLEILASYGIYIFYLKLKQYNFLKFFVKKIKFY